MAIIDLFSKRTKRQQGDVPDVYSYDQIPNALRVQIIHLWNDALGTHDDCRLELRHAQRTYTAIVSILVREYGLFALNEAARPHGPKYQLETFFLKERDVNRVLDVVELTARAIDQQTREFNYLGRHHFDEAADEALAELNCRFREHGIGYQYEQGELLRVDSQLVHQDVVKPAIRLLSDSQYSGAEQEFLAAHEHYRKGRAKEALNDALKSLESTLKTICKRRGWNVDPNATAKTLIDVVYQSGLIPSFWQSQWAGLRSILENGVPTGRNRLSGHGQGEVPVDVPDHLAGYVLHLTASAIVYLVQSEKALA